MRITTEKYPILDILRENSGFDLLPEDRYILLTHGNYVIDEFINRLDRYKQHIHICTEPFSNAFIEAKQKMFDMAKDGQLKNKEYFNGTYIRKYGDTTRSITYDINIDSQGYGGVVYMFIGSVLMAYCIGNKSWVSEKYISTNENWADKDYPNDKIAHYFIIEAMVFGLFLKYAEIETKHLPPKSKTSDGKIQHKNETNSTVTILDSTWFTTLVKSDAFKVRGHFRLQPCGEGRKERKLIWINDFQKSGYTSPARKLNNND